MGQGAAGRALQIPRKDASETHSVYLGATIHAIGTALQSFSSLEALEAEEHSELCVLVILDLLLLCGLHYFEAKTFGAFPAHISESLDQLAN